MISFASDYVEGAHEAVLQRLMETNREQLSGYGTDVYSERARGKIKAACATPEGQVWLTVGGTQTNQIVISSLLKSYEGVISASSGHIGGHEAGAIEYSGHKVLSLPEHAGKLCPSEVEQYLREFYADANYEHMVFPGMVYISYPTEYGTLYTKDELTHLSQICRTYNIPLYLDGARLGYGLASPACDLTLPELAALVDVLYIGGTKVGALCGEAVVFTHGNMPPYFTTIVKQHGALMAKGRLLGIQFDVLFTDQLYLKLSAHAIAMAEKLRAVFVEKGYRFSLDSPTNQLFVVLSAEQEEALRDKVAYSYWERLDADHIVARFATSWATTEESIEYLSTVL
ncbi:MAG: low specificity L-threonine aldolase [Clostridia bacterium]|nr:low specificity L-threonine aldolase [Clostridia bacterium]